MREVNVICNLLGRDYIAIVNGKQYDVLMNMDDTVSVRCDGKWSHYPAACFDRNLSVQTVRRFFQEDAE